MRTFSINTVEDAQDLIRFYDLDRFDWGVGSAQGFADHLFVAGREHMDLERVCAEIESYLEEANGDTAHTRIRSADATYLQQCIADYMDQRRELATMIRKVKWTACHGSVWELISRLATHASPADLLAAQQVTGLLPSVRDVLQQLAIQIEPFEGCRIDSYLPGASEILDGLVQKGIQKFDEVLTSLPAWPGREPERSLEITALHRITRDVGLLRMLELLIQQEGSGMLECAPVEARQVKVQPAPIRSHLHS